MPTSEFIGWLQFFADRAKEEEPQQLDSQNVGSVLQGLGL